MKKYLFILVSLYANTVCSSPVSTLYNSLDPNSISQQLAFFELYEGYPESQYALRRLQWLLKVPPQQSMQRSTIQAMIDLINKEPHGSAPVIDSNDLKWIEQLGSCFANRKLKGYKALSEEDVLALQPDEIDLARALFLTQLDSIDDVKNYEAAMDLMAFQIKARLPANPSPKEIILAMNHYIFDEMGFRFPPKSTFGEDIDRYTFLTSVIDSKRGVCLGVSLLYMCLAQRLDLKLEMITPPGHIYVRYSAPDGSVVNIETTARGIHLDSEDYLSVETKSLEKRNLREVIGLAYVNEGAASLRKKDYAKQWDCYLKAKRYMGEDNYLKGLMAIGALFTGRYEEGLLYFRAVKDFLPEHAVVKDTIADDYISGEVNVEGLKLLFSEADESREALLARRKQVEDILTQYPRFRAGIAHLASIWLELHRTKEALETLNRYHSLDATNPAIEYYLAVLNAQRLNYQAAWDHLYQAEKIVSACDYAPRDLKELRRELSRAFPE